MKLTILGEMVSLNEYIKAERTNKFMAAKIKKEETEQVYWACKEQKLKKITEPITEILIDWYTKNDRKDADNVFFACKFILDGMVLAGVLPDDGRKYINAISHRAYVDKNERIEIEIL